MNLYFSPGACSLSPHIVLREVGAKFDLVQVSTKTKTTLSGDDFLAINPKGQVPALRLDDGEILTEGPAIVQYIADKYPEAKLAPPAGTLARTHVQEWLNWVSSEVHKTYTPLFNPNVPDAYKAIAIENLGKKFDYAEKRLEKSAFLAGDTFGIADAYFYVMLRWIGVSKLDLAKWPALEKYKATIDARPAVRAAVEAEKLK